MSRYARRIDGNHKQIRDGLRQLGFFVWDTSRLGGGTPDLWVCQRSSNQAVWVEVKMPRENLTPDEVEFFADCPPGNAIIATSIDDVLAFFNSD